MKKTTVRALLLFLALFVGIIIGLVLGDPPLEGDGTKGR